MENEKNDFGAGERFVRDAYDKYIDIKPTFDEEMQKHIQEELEHMKQEYLEFLKSKEKEN